MQLTLAQKRAAAGAIGGKARSEKKTEAVRRNASLPRPKARIANALKRAKNNFKKS